MKQKQECCHEPRYVRIPKVLNRQIDFELAACTPFDVYVLTEKKGKARMTGTWLLTEEGKTEKTIYHMGKKLENDKYFDKI